MRKLAIIIGLVGCTNEPQYVQCPLDGPAAMDRCSIVANANSALPEQSASLHIPVKPESIWRARDRAVRAELQMTLDPAVEVPIYRLEHYDISVEWSVRNNAASPGKFFVDLNGANEAYAYDPSQIILNPGDDNAPPTPPLAGNIPIEIAANGVVEGVFREDQLLEAAIDLDQISRGNVNVYAATLTVSKNAEMFQPLTASVYDPATGDVTPGVATGPAVPRAAFRQLVRVDLVFRPDRDMQLDFTVRVREHVEVVHEEGLNALGDELAIMNPPAYVP